jgi:hypothetical protein
MPGRPAKGPKATGQALTKEQQEAAAILQKYAGVQQLPRTAGLVLRARAELAAPKGPAGKPFPVQPPDGSAEVQDFYLRTVTGDWVAVASHLAKLPTEARPLVYSHLLTLLTKGKQAIMLPDEILALADASPGGLSDEQLTMLGQLLSQSREKLGVPKAMLAELKGGTKRLGGSSSRNRLAAARLLSAAGLIDQAMYYLPAATDIRKAKDPVIVNLYAACQQSLAEKDHDDHRLGLAWDLSRMVLETAHVAEEPRDEAVQRLVALIPKMPEETVADWIRHWPQERPHLGMLVLAAATQRVEQSFFEKAIPPRLAALAAECRLVQGLLAAGKHDPCWKAAIRMMTITWMSEAAYSINDNTTATDIPEVAEMDLSDPAARESYVQARQAAARGGENEIPRLAVKDLLSVIPEEAWFQVLDPDVARQARRLAGRIAAEAGDRQRCFAVIRSLVDGEPKLAKELAERYLVAWSDKLQGNSDSDESSSNPQPYQRKRGGRYSPYPSYSPSGGYTYGNNRSGGVPLIRAKQAQNLAELADLLSVLQAMKVPMPSENVLVGVFDACHSPAEVYRDEDLRLVFGNLETLRPETLLQIVSALRMKLADQWRKPEVQEQAATQRTDKEQVAEIVRGYGLANRLLDAAAARLPTSMEPVLLRGMVAFDLAEFLYGQKADLKTYTTIRDRAFAAYRQAAALYAASLPLVPRQLQNVNVFRQWFQSALGASDLAYLTRQERPDLDEIDRVATAMRKLGGEAAQRHLALFAQGVVESISEIPPHLKPHYLRQACRVLAGSAAGEAVRRRLKFYDDLLSEVQLNIAIDGDAAVGHKVPFGGQLSIRYTAALGRESSDFSQLLQKTWSQTSNREIDYPKEIEQAVTEKLNQAFDVEIVRFHDPRVASRGIGRPGWRETPLAYLVLHAKTPSVDRIPTVSVDLEFNDGAGMVLLPVASQVALIDARDASPPVRPLADLKIRQVLDARRWDKGTAQLEVVAEARGIIPPLDRLIEIGDGSLPGFRVARTQDQGLELKSLDTAGERICPVCERRWLLDLEPAGDVAVAQFAFPKARAAATAMTYQHYSDADIVDAASTVPLRAGAFSGRAWVVPLVAVIVVVASAIVVFRRTRRRFAAPAGPCYRRPEPLTPFTLLVLLRRINQDQSVTLAEADRRSLEESIAGMERQFFERAAESSVALELAAVADRWLTAVGDSQKHRRRPAKPNVA